MTPTIPRPHYHDESPSILLLDLLLGVTIGVLSACVAVLVAVS